MVLDHGCERCGQLDPQGCYEYSEVDDCLICGHCCDIEDGAGCRCPCSQCAMHDVDV